MLNKQKLNNKTRTSKILHLTNWYSLNPNDMYAARGVQPVRSVQTKLK
jgi:hypothetical protein